MGLYCTPSWHWKEAIFENPDAAIGSVLKFEGIVQNQGDTTDNDAPFAYLDTLSLKYPKVFAVL